jgi:hypothetical protein
LLGYPAYLVRPCLFLYTLDHAEGTVVRPPRSWKPRR